MNQTDNRMNPEPGTQRLAVPSSAAASASGAEAELAEARAEIARMRLRLDHRDLFDDETLALCKATDPEGIAEWGAGIVRFAQHVKDTTPEPERQHTPDDLSAFASPSPVPSPIRRRGNNLEQAIRGK
ncbi:hypothetical protein [uncultured Bifidobacterium sp.]|uniref:hypothetical protein n=1 Tax=uncultured Bifidobacterium sp. TaxID=165187 RepID=UPI0025871928|nr:hypothetical protein [uncultured Bifidobacterium sp.]